MPENCAAIIIAAKHHELSKVKDIRGTTNTVGALRCKFQFRTDDWLHSAKTAMFCNGDAVLHPEVIDDAIAVPLDADDECPVPYEVLTDTLPYSIGVWGITNSGLRVVSKWLVFNAQLGCYTEGNAPEDPEKTIYEEILLASKEAVDAAADVTNRANSGEFDGKTAYELAQEDGFEGSVSEWIQSLVGEKGDDGYTPVKGTDYFTDTEVSNVIDEVKAYASNQDVVVLAEAQAYTRRAKDEAVAAAKAEIEAYVRAIAEAVYTKSEVDALIEDAQSWGEF